MTQDQRCVYEKIIAGPRRALAGPLRAAIHCPELADHWQSLGAYLRFHTSLAPRLSELAILATARRWNSQLEWYIHSESARKAGLAESIIEALRNGRSPEFEDPDEFAIYEYARQLQSSGQVSEATYGKVLAQWDVLGVVELTALIGYYTMVSMTLNAHEIPLPDGAKAPLTPVGSHANGGVDEHRELTDLLPGRFRSAAKG
jgi:4-carboxymuconolactone decarboxylase